MIQGLSGDVATDQFLTLLVSQLQHQDPLDPVSQENFISQLAEFSTLSGIEELNGSFESMVSQQGDLIRLQQLSVGSNLIGKIVEFVPADGSQQTQQGTVQRISMVQGQLALDVGGQTVGLNQVTHVVGPPAQ